MKFELTVEVISMFKITHQRYHIKPDSHNCSVAVCKYSTLSKAHHMIIGTIACNMLLFPRKLLFRFNISCKVTVKYGC
jgi:hypothetical protein